MVRKLVFTMTLICVMGWVSSTFGQNEQIHVWIGDHPNAYTKLVVGETNRIKVKLICWQQTVRIADLHIPVATNNTYITQRLTNGIFYPPLSTWVEHNFLNPNTVDSMPGWTNQSIYCQRLNDNEQYLNPYSTNLIAEYSVNVANNPNWVGDTIQAVSIIKAGSSGTLGNIAIGDTVGGPGYTNLVQHYLPVIFVPCGDTNYIGTGRGIIGNQQNHIDTECITDSFALFDISRNAVYTQHGHNGQMQTNAAIVTYKYQSISPQTIVIKDIDNSWTDSLQWPGVDAHVYSGYVYDFMLSSIGRNGYDNLGFNISSWVDHPYSGWHNLALYNDGKAIFGTVDQDYRSLAGCPDVVAHEWGHGITAYEANLAYEKESGALSESFSDMFAAAFNDGYLNDHSTWWKIGRNFYRNYPNKVVTDMQNPNNTGQAQTYINDSLWFNIVNCTPSLSNDYCGVHQNSGVPTKMFYLLAAGGTFNNISVQGIGVQNAFKIMYEANRQSLWPSNSTFWNARDGSIRAALQIDTTTHMARNVADAWNAVGVCDTCDYIPGDVNGNGEARGSDITLLVAFLKQLAPPPPDSCHIPYQINGRDWFYVAADYNGDCQISGSDITWGVAYYKGFRPEIRYCPHFSPSLP